MESLREGAWAGRRAFILGGGPSLSSDDVARLDGELTLGLNMAFLYNPTATLIYDKRLLDSLVSNLAWRAYTGGKFWLNSESLSAPRGDGEVRQLREHRVNPAYPFWSKTMNDGLYRGNNAGSAGISFVDILGASPIYLLGFDMRAEAGKPPNWHTLYPEQWRASKETFVSYCKDLMRISTFVRSKVVNLTPGSALTAFPMGTLDDVLREPGVTS